MEYITMRPSGAPNAAKKVKLSTITVACTDGELVIDRPSPDALVNGAGPRGEWTKAEISAYFEFFASKPEKREATFRGQSIAPLERLYGIARRNSKDALQNAIVDWVVRSVHVLNDIYEGIAEVRAEPFD